MTYFDSTLEAQKRAQSLADATGHDYVVWVEKYKPYRATYTRDNQDNTMRAPFGMSHWSNHKPTGETTP